MSNDIEITLSDLEDLLFLLDPNLPFNTWSKIGRAIYSEFGDSARDAFESWSANGSSFNKKQFNGWWRNFRKTRKTSIGSFIYELQQVGWKPKQSELSETEKAERRERINKAKADNAKKLEQAELDQWQALKVEQQEFAALKPYSHPTAYFLDKHMADANQFIDLRQGVDSHGKHFTAWPIWSELGNKGVFSGYERILDKKINLHGKWLNKFSSSHARTDIGFATFGPVENISRIFVVGGFADAYTCHSVTGETIVTPIGESNIPNVVAILAKAYPELQIIAGPDNDKQGEAVIKECDGPWTLPLVDNADWSDVWLNEGNEVLTQQLTHVRGFTHIKSETRYLQAQIKTGLNLLKSGMGTGKSTTVKQYIASNPHDSVLIISHRKSLAKDLAADINSVETHINTTEQERTIEMKYYEDMVISSSGNGVDANAALRAAKHLVISVDSLWRLAGAKFDTIFIDEVEQGLGHFFAETNRHAENCLSMLKFFLTHSKTQILADAHLGELTKEFCAELGMHSGVLNENTFKVGQGRTMYIYENKNHLTEHFSQQIMKGQQAYVYANSKTEIKKLATSIRQHQERKHWTGEMLEIHADSVRQDKGVIKALEDINQATPNLDVLLASPTLGTGFDIKAFDTKSQRGHRFETTYGFLNSHVGTAEEGHQGINRARNVNEYHLFLDPAERSEPTDAQYIHDKLIEEVSFETAKLLEIDTETGEWCRKDSLFERLYAKVKAKQNLSKNNYRARFIELAKLDGYKVIEIAKNEMAAEFGKLTRAEAGHRNDRINLREIDSAPLHTDEAYDAMIINSENYTSAEYNKSRVAKALNIMAANDEDIATLTPLAESVYNDFAYEGDNFELSPDLDSPVPMPENKLSAIINALSFLQDKSHFSSKLSKLSLLNINLDNAKELDLRNIKKVQSRVKWEHKSIKKRHLITLLAAAGINEKLDYCGTTWSKEQVKDRLLGWMIKNEDALYKYSGTKISDAAKADPVQWFNNHLRANGVPVESLGQRRIKGKQCYCYGVDKEKWEQVKTLIKLRNKGIAEYLLQREETETATEFDPAANVTPRDSVDNIQIVQGVTTLGQDELQNFAANSLNTEGRGDALSPVMDSESTENTTLSRLVSLVVDKMKLPLDYVTQLIENEREQWLMDINDQTMTLQQWAMTIKDLYLYDCTPPMKEQERLDAFSF